MSGGKWGKVGEAVVYSGTVVLGLQSRDIECACGTHTLVVSIHVAPPIRHPHPLHPLPPTTTTHTHTHAHTAFRPHGNRSYVGLGGRLAQNFSILPETFVLPKEYIGFVDAFSRSAEAAAETYGSTKFNTWIMKPVGSSRGRGISVVNDIAQVCYGEDVVIQRYIMDPMLLDGYKFDLRM